LLDVQEEEETDVLLPLQVPEIDPRRLKVSPRVSWNSSLNIVEHGNFNIKSTFETFIDTRCLPLGIINKTIMLVV
jgi:hypothetical protein